MKNKIITLLLVLALLIPTSVLAQSQGNTLYVNSVSGSDTNNCTIVTPCKTFARAQSLANAGMIIKMTGGFTGFKITKSNITVTGNNYAGKIIDDDTNGRGIQVQRGADNVTIDGFEVTNTNDHCIITEAKNTVIKNNYVHDCVLIGLDVSQQYGSGIKGTQHAENMVVINNIVKNVHGECIAFTMVKGGVAQGNYIENCKAPYVYIDNSDNIVVDGNFMTCTNPAFKRGANLSFGVGMSNENYSDYGWQGGILNNVTITNNIITKCSGIYYFKNLNFGLKNVFIAHNTLWQTVTGIGAESGAGQTNIQVKNNLYNGSNWFQSGIGVVQSNNLVASASMFAVTPNELNPETYRLRIDINVLDVGVLADYFGVMRLAPISIGAIEFSGGGITLTPSLPVTFTSAPSLTPTLTQTITPVYLTGTSTRTATPSRTPTVTKTVTPTGITVKPTVCVPEYLMCIVPMP